MDFKAYVIEKGDILEQYPEAIGIACDDCSLEYSLRHYDILKNNKKLIYFNLYWDRLEGQDEGTPLLCHECFFKKIKKMSDGEEVKIVVSANDKEIVMSFKPSDTPTNDPDDDDYLGLF